MYKLSRSNWKRILNGYQGLIPIIFLNKIGKSEVPDWQKICQANVEVRYVQYINKNRGNMNADI